MIVWTLIAMIAAWAGFRLFGGYPAPEASLEVLAPREAAFLDAAAEAMFPAVGVLPISGREAELPRYVDRWLVLLPPRQKFLIRALLFLVEQATIFFPAPGPSLRRFSSLSPPAREAWLRAWGESGLGLRRLVFTSLRAVLTMGYLGHPAVLRHVHLAPLGDHAVTDVLDQPALAASPARRAEGGPGRLCRPRPGQPAGWPAGSRPGRRGSRSLGRFRLSKEVLARESPAP